ncbi:hypothetical protein HG536_0C02070 [Torulaspora globosa]|uniref:RING-type domain-containing protein n=1 Tax=Torulaspora globosa TaxID=48254 RepID=A0A7G3ZEV2_9SACH|nr:uncharacterized protein HG536_0C02070 [Torulaspora globosa]QLL32038.1 hypothetical protein HG536_0C02070 [Torulaspora globosa]
MGNLRREQKQAVRAYRLIRTTPYTAMQSSNDSIIFQLTNIGAAQRDSPVRTPKKLGAQLDGPLTPPPSSKGKRWAERFASFPRSSERRKKSVGSPSPEKGTTVAHSVAISPPMAPGRSKAGPISCEPDAQYPSRTDSLPRPTLELLNHKSRGKEHRGPSSPYTTESLRRLQRPRVLPFGYSDARASPKKSFLNCVCTVCDEPIFTRSHGERIIELECGHTTHHECLLVSLEASRDIKSGEILDAFPSCTKCQEECKKDVKCLPKNHDLKDKLISEFLINKNLGSAGGIRRRSSTQAHPGLASFLSSPAVTTAKHDVQQHLMPAMTWSTRSAFQVPLVEDGQMKRKPSRAIPQSHSISKGSSWTASSSIVSSANDLTSIISADVSVLESSQRGPLERSQLPILRAYFMEVLLANFEGSIINWEVDSVYGLLRLADKLLVSSDGTTYANCLCYLFEKALIVANISSENFDNLISTRLTDLKVFAPISGIKVEAVESSIFKCTIASDASYQELFLTETLNTDTSQIIQKWISGLLNHDFIFDESNFTSTLPIPPIIRQLKGRADRGSLIGMVGSSKIIELAGLDQLSDSVIVRRGLKLPPASAEVHTEIETMETVMTTISSILSLKREKPDDLVVVVQCNFEDPSFANSLPIIHNSIKALNIKFRDLKICVVNAKGYVVQHGLADKISFGPDSITSFQRNSVAKKFNPQWLREAFYPSGVLGNVGVAVVSATSMEEEKSCLLMDYKPFTCSGRRRPNELKVKVGYLNVDYSDSIDELVEVAAWANVLEALSYSFSLVFGDDEDEELSADDSSDYCTAFKKTDLSKSDSILNNSVTAILPTGPGEEGEGEDKCSVYDTERHSEPDFFQSKNVMLTSGVSEPAQRGSVSAKRSDKGWDPLLDDIESAIRELQRGRSASPGRHSGYSYSYI